MGNKEGKVFARHYENYKRSEFFDGILTLGVQLLHEQGPTLLSQH